MLLYPLIIFKVNEYNKKYLHLFKLKGNLYEHLKHFWFFYILL